MMVRSPSQGRLRCAPFHRMAAGSAARSASPEPMNRKQRRAQGQVKSRKPAAPDPAVLYEAGLTAYRAGELARAADLIGQAIAASGPLPELHYNLAIVLKA